jgi:hypothetical protein
MQALLLPWLHVMHMPHVTAAAAAVLLLLT